MTKVLARLGYYRSNFREMPFRCNNVRVESYPLQHSLSCASRGLRGSRRIRPSADSSSVSISAQFMSAKITSITLEGKQKTLTRARAQRLVDSGSHDWQGSRTIREKRIAKAVPSYHERIMVSWGFEFDDSKHAGPGLGPLPGDHPLPYTYPLPYDILSHYQSNFVASA